MAYYRGACVKAVARLTGLLLLLVLAAFLRPAAAEPPQVLLHAGFEGSADAAGREMIYPNRFSSKGEPLTIFEYEPGVVGRAARFTWTNGYPGVTYPTEGAFDPNRGTLSYWVRKTDPFYINQYFPNIWGLGNETMARANPLVLVALNDPKAAVIEDGKWHHCLYTWDSVEKKRRQYLDGELLAEDEYRSPYRAKELIIGYRLTGSMDEIAILDRPLDAAEVKSAYAVYRQGKSPFTLPKPAKREYIYPLEIAALPSARPELPAGLDWLVMKPTAGNQSRTRYELSGRWRFQPSAAERSGAELVNPGLFGTEWAYANAPGNWQADKIVFDQAGKLLAAWQGKPLKDFPAAWYERDFNLPARHRTGRVLLHFPRVLGLAAVYLNGRLVGRVETTAPRTFELNSFLAWDRPNRLTVYNGLPFAAGMRVNGFAEAPALEVRDTQEFDLSQPLINPSFRRSSLDLILPVENLSGKALTLSARLRILDYREDKEVFLSEPREIKLAKGFNGDQAVSFPVSGLKTWSPETPNLYRCVVEISQAGKVVDLAYPEAFGYREVWVSGSDIFLNGKHLSIRGKSHNYLNGYGFNVQELALLKETGQNADRTNSPQPEFEKTLTVTDEFGWLVFYNGGGDRAAIRKILGRVGNHPSFIGWQYWSNGYINGPHGHPMQIGGRVDEAIQKSDPDYQVMRELSQWDPYRINAYYRLGAGGQFRSIMHYIGFGTPVQNMAEWTRWWAKEKPEPLVPMELTALQITQETPLWHKGSKEIVLAEQVARYFGERPYQQVDDALAATFAKPDFGINQWLLSPIRYDAKCLVLERTLRAWRTYGINGYLLHMDGKVDQSYTAGKLNRQGETLKRNNSPVLFHLAGPESDFVAREHHFFAGQPVRKSAIVINDRFDTLSGRVDWQVVDASGRKLAGGGQAVTVENGGRLFVPVEFTAPAVQARQELVITATLQDGGGQLLYDDRFPVQIFPLAPFTWDRNTRVMLIDSHGDTSRLLEEMGVPYQVLNKDVIDRGLSSFKGYSLLIIGRNSYPEAAEIFKTWMPATGAVEEGLNIICLEQLNRYVMGLRTEKFDTHDVFIRAADSPLFAGLADADFADWNGAATQFPAYPSWDTRSDWQSGNASKHGQRNSFGQLRNWHWSNLGTVATCSFEKPQLGNFRVLMDNGFDLLYTPLVEWRLGRGRLLFSQLDITDRYGSDPVATLLFQRMLKEYSRPLSSAPATLGYLGDGRQEYLLQEAGLAYQKVAAPEGRALFLEAAAFSREKSPSLPAALAAFLDQGGTVLVALEKAEDAWLLPVKLEAGRKPVFKSSLPAGPEFSGLGMSEFYWRGTREFLTLAGAGGRWADSGLAGVVDYGKGRLVFLQVEPKGFEKFWQRSKILRIYNTLATNLGVGSSIKPDFTAIGGYGRPEEWLPGSTGVDVAARPELKESNLYRQPALDFDPDQHHVW